MHWTQFLQVFFVSSSKILYLFWTELNHLSLFFILIRRLFVFLSHGILRILIILIILICLALVPKIIRMIITITVIINISIIIISTVTCLTNLFIYLRTHIIKTVITLRISFVRSTTRISVWAKLIILDLCFLSLLIICEKVLLLYLKCLWLLPLHSLLVKLAFYFIRNQLLF